MYNSIFENYITEDDKRQIATGNNLPIEQRVNLLKEYLSLEDLKELLSHSTFMPKTLDTIGLIPDVKFGIEFEFVHKKQDARNIKIYDRST